MTRILDLRRFHWWEDLGPWRKVSDMNGNGEWRLADGEALPPQWFTDLEI